MLTTSQYFRVTGLVFPYLICFRALRSTEMLGGTKNPVHFVDPISGHCIARIRSDQSLVIGGYNPDGNEISSETFLYDAFNITEGPYLIQPRYWHACDTYLHGTCVNGSDIDAFVIVAGGKTSNGYTSSTEMIGFQFDKWLQGPDIPIQEGQV